MQQRPGRNFPIDTMYACMRTLRFSFLVAALTPGLLAAQMRLPTGAVAVNPDSGQVVYREQRSAMYSDGRLVQSDVLCLSGQAQSRGRINLSLGGEYAELDWHGADGERVQLTRADDRWISRYTSDERVQTQVSWPRIRKHDLIEDQLLAYLQSNIDALKQQQIDSLVSVRAPDFRRHSFKISVTALDAQRLDVRLSDHGWFADPEGNMRFVVHTDGRLLSYQGPARCPMPDQQMPRVDVRYLY